MLQVADDGYALPEAGVDGPGLRGMHERALLIGAVLTIQANSRSRAADRTHDPDRPPGRVIVPPPSPVRILVADDFAVVREGVKALLERQADLQVTAFAVDGREAVEKATTADVDLAILDIAMPTLTGLQAVREIVRRRPDLPILMLSMHAGEQYFFEALAAGAAGYVLKQQADRDIVAACRAVLRGEPFIYPPHSAC